MHHIVKNSGLRGYINASKQKWVGYDEAISGLELVTKTLQFSGHFIIPISTLALQ